MSCGEKDVHSVRSGSYNSLVRYDNYKLYSSGRVHAVQHSTGTVQTYSTGTVKHSTVMVQHSTGTVQYLYLYTQYSVGMAQYSAIYYSTV